MDRRHFIKGAGIAGLLAFLQACRLTNLLDRSPVARVASNLDSKPEAHHQAAHRYPNPPANLHPNLYHYTSTHNRPWYTGRDQYQHLDPYARANSNRDCCPGKQFRLPHCHSHLNADPNANPLSTRSAQQTWPVCDKV